MKRTVLAILSTAALAIVAGTASAAAHPVVVELFTSQGCASCPAADKVLAELAEREDVVALSWAVDYWDYLGWTDTFAVHANTLRQRAYNESLGRQVVFTPQMVIDGRRQLVGSRRGEVMTALAQAAAVADEVTVAIDRNADGGYVANLAGGGDQPAVVRMVWYDTSRAIDVERGENKGRSLSYTNIVRGSQVIGHYDGTAVSLDLPLEDLQAMKCDGFAVIVQRDPIGPVVGAAAQRVGE